MSSEEPKASDALDERNPNTLNTPDENIALTEADQQRLADAWPRLPKDGDDPLEKLIEHDADGPS